MSNDAIVDAMQTYGGSFVQALAVAWRRADAINRAKLQTAFADVWAKYADLADLKQRRA